MAINLSKISFGITLLRLTNSWAKWYTWFAIGTLAAFALPAAILPWVQCRPLAKTFVDLIPGECIDKRPSVKFAEFQAGTASHQLSRSIWTLTQCSLGRTYGRLARSTPMDGNMECPDAHDGEGWDWSSNESWNTVNDAHVQACLRPIELTIS